MIGIGTVKPACPFLSDDGGVDRPVLVLEDELEAELGGVGEGTGQGLRVHVPVGQQARLH